MSDEYSTIYLILTSYIPQFILMIFFPLLLIGVAFRAMRNPLY